MLAILAHGFSRLVRLYNQVIAAYRLAIPRERIRRWVARILAVVLVTLVVTVTLSSPPAGFPVSALVSIPEGASLSEALRILRGQHVIRSPFLARVLVTVRAGERGIVAGDYVFHEPVGVFGVVGTITSGRYGFELAKVTIPEGTSVREIADLLSKRFLVFDADEFVRKATPLEGYLFPDTYYFLENVTADQVIRVMRDTFDKKIVELTPDIAAFGKPIEDVIILASLLEEEARTEETRRTIAGILWRRLERGIPLQVDAVFPYIIGKNTFQLTLDDLQFDSPYNTYRYKGLPPGPITNPGLDAIRAAVNPIWTTYLFYLSDHSGAMHYARTFEEHKLNKARYLY